MSAAIVANVRTGEIIPRPYLQASFVAADGVLHQSFALLRKRPDGRAESVAVADCDGKQITRYLAACYLGKPANERAAFIALNAAFRAAVLATLKAGPAATYESGSYGPELCAV